MSHPANRPPMKPATAPSMPAPKPASSPDSESVSSGVKIPGMQGVPQKDPGYQGDPTL